MNITANIKTHCRSRQGCEIVPFAYAAGSDKDSVWALREGVNLRCYYLADVLLPDGVHHISGILPSLHPIGKAEAHKIADERIAALRLAVDLNSRRGSILYGGELAREMVRMDRTDLARAYAAHYGLDWPSVIL